MPGLPEQGHRLGGLKEHRFYYTILEAKIEMLEGWFLPSLHSLADRRSSSPSVFISSKLSVTVSKILFLQSYWIRSTLMTSFQFNSPSRCYLPLLLGLLTKKKNDPFSKYHHPLRVTCTGFRTLAYEFREAGSQFITNVDKTSNSIRKNWKS